MPYRSGTSLLVRHRWIGDPALELWRCTRGVLPMYESPDPLCSGCRDEIAWSEVPRLERYRNLTEHPLGAEDLGVRLDLVVLERACAEAR